MSAVPKNQRVKHHNVLNWLSLPHVHKYVPIVVMTVAAKMTALGQFQLLKVLLPVMVTPWPAASDTT